MASVRKRDNFEAEFDARTIADAEAIKSDKKRFNAAKKAAVKMAKKEQIKVNALKKIAKKK